MPDIVMTLVTVVHVFTCLLIILIVMVQGGGNVDITAAFGGASQTAFGPRGSVTMLHKATWTLAVIFVLTSITLGVWASRGSSGSILEGSPAATEAPAPAEPETPPVEP